MTKNRSVLVLGILVAVMPFLGFPSNLKTFFFVIFGLMLIVLSLIWAGEKRRLSRQENKTNDPATDVYVENSVPAVPKEEVFSHDQFASGQNNINIELGHSTPSVVAVKKKRRVKSSLSNDIKINKNNSVTETL